MSWLLIASTALSRLFLTNFSLTSFIIVTPRLEIIDPAQAIIMKRKKTRQTLLKVVAALANSASDVAGVEINCGTCDPLRKIEIAR